MSKKIGVIAEDNSDVEVIANLLEKYMPRNRFSIKKFVGNGCGKLKNKCDVWTDYLFKTGCEHVLIFHDLDRNDEAKLRTTIRKKVPETDFPNSLVVIPVEEIEAWLLSDATAIKKVFNLQTQPKKISNCDEIKSPKEHLAELVWTIGKKRYLNSVHNKQLSESISLKDLKRCRSYQPFDDYVTQNICA